MRRRQWAPCPVPLIPGAQPIPLKGHTEGVASQQPGEPKAGWSCWEPCPLAGMKPWPQRLCCCRRCSLGSGTLW